MRVGTKSLLFGVHQFLWHPWTVALAWRSLYGVWPKWHEWVAIFCHDLGYWGTPNMDGEEGQRHPEKGAHMARFLVYEISRLAGIEKLDAVIRSGRAWQLCIGHSRYYAAKHGVELSKLFRADKVSVLHDPPRFYLLRAKASGEIYEYMENAPAKAWSTFLGCPRGWLKWYRSLVRERFLQCTNSPASTSQS